MEIRQYLYKSCLEIFDEIYLFQFSYHIFCVLLTILNIFDEKTNDDPPILKQYMLCCSNWILIGY